MTVMTAAEVLRQARALILERGWVPFDTDGGLSIYGAVGLATLGHAFGEGGPFESEAAWAVAIGGPCSFLEGLIAKPAFVGIAHWEMGDDRTQSDVVVLFDKAIALAEIALGGDAAVAA